MTLHVELSTDDHGSPIELANAIIKYHLETHGITAHSSYNETSNIINCNADLLEIADHILAYLKGCNKRAGI